MYTGCSIWSETGVESGLWFGCFTVLPNCTTTSAKFPSALAKLGRRWNEKYHSQPSLGLIPDGTPYASAILKRFFN